MSHKYITEIALQFYENLSQFENISKSIFSRTENSSLFYLFIKSLSLTAINRTTNNVAFCKINEEFYEHQNLFEKVMKTIEGDYLN